MPHIRRASRSRAALQCAAVLLLTGCADRAEPADVGIVSTWPAVNYGLARAERVSPPGASRIAAYAAIALYEGWAAFSDSLRTFVGQLNGLTSLPKPEPKRR
ncbi:MAG: hypothetical protein ABI647_26160, partial [Gemmatimonadota bacterium]